MSQKAAETKQLSPRLAGEWFGISIASVYQPAHEQQSSQVQLELSQVFMNFCELTLARFNIPTLQV